MEHHPLPGRAGRFAPPLPLDRLPCDTSRMNVLIIEDEDKLSGYLVSGLEQEGFTVERARSGLDGLHLAMESEFDVIVLDRMLPGLDGLSVLKALRTRRRTAVLMLTALGDVDDRVEGLRAGADDYLAKPFSFSELVARIEALARRRHDEAAGDGASSTRLSIGDLDMDLEAKKVTRAGRPLELTVKEFRLLALLLSRQGKVLSRGEIAERVWDMNFDGDTNVVEVAVRRLRVKLDVPFEQKLLHTVRGMGYVLERRDG